MALKAVVENQSEIPEGVESFYEEQDGKFVLKVEGLTEKSKLDEFRNSNIELKKQVDEVQETLEKFKGIDPSIAREALEVKKQMENKELMEKGQFEELLEKSRVEYEGKIEALQKHSTEQESSAKKYKDELELIELLLLFNQPLMKLERHNPLRLLTFWLVQRTLGVLMKREIFFVLTNRGKLAIVKMALHI